MKILLLSNMYPSNDHLFYGVFVKNFYDSMKYQGIEIEKVVISGRGKTIKEKITKYFAYYRDSLKEIKKNNYDAIYIHGASLALIPIALARKKIKKPIFINIHGGDIMNNSLFNRVLFKINKAAINNADLLVLPSYAFKENISTKIVSEKTFISPSGGINKEVFNYVAENPKAKSHIDIGYVSRLDRGKGWDTFITAISLIKIKKPNLEIKVTIVGDGEQLLDMKKMISTLNLEKVINHIPQLQQKELSQIYRNLDLFVFPTKLSESLGLVGLEAMACGTPIIASKIGGITDYINDGINGFSFQPGNSEELSEKILSYAKLDQDKKNDLSAGAIITANRYDSLKISSDLFSEIKKIIDTN